MKVADLKTPPAQLASKLDDAKEGIVDALLNLTWRRTSGAGTDGQIVFGVKPSLRFVSGFLLPRFEETGQRDETSDISARTAWTFRSRRTPAANLPLARHSPFMSAPSRPGTNCCRPNTTFSQTIPFAAMWKRASATK
jgi:hypothetical protein